MKNYFKLYCNRTFPFWRELIAENLHQIFSENFRTPSFQIWVQKNIRKCQKWFTSFWYGGNKKTRKK